MDAGAQLLSRCGSPTTRKALGRCTHSHTLFRPSPSLPPPPMLPSSKSIALLAACVGAAWLLRRFHRQVGAAIRDFLDDRPRLLRDYDARVLLHERHALLADCEGAAVSLAASASDLARLAAGMVERHNAAAQRALPAGALQAGPVAVCARALLMRKARVVRAAQRRLRLQGKKAAAAIETAEATRELLCVLVRAVSKFAPLLDLACASSLNSFDCAFAVLPLLASLPNARASSVAVHLDSSLPHGKGLGGVATGDELRVVCASGQGLQWFLPHSRNRFSAALALADGSVPSWLTAGDVKVAVTPCTGTALARHRAVVDSQSDVRNICATSTLLNGILSVDYGGVPFGKLEAVLSMTVCGVGVVDAATSEVWAVRVRRRVVSEHSCVATGELIRKMHIPGMRGMAVSADEKWLVLSRPDQGLLAVHSLPGGELVHTFGGRGVGRLQFNGMSRMGFDLLCKLVVVDSENKRLQVVILTGELTKIVNLNAADGYPFCVDTRSTGGFAVGFRGGTGPRVVLFDHSWKKTTSFGDVGDAPGQLSRTCTAVRYAHGGVLVAVAEQENRRVSLFRAGGQFVRCVGVGVLGGGCIDIAASVTGEFIVADAAKRRVRVFSLDGSEQVRSWGGVVQFAKPNTLATAGPHLYVMDTNMCNVHVFE